MKLEKVDYDMEQSKNSQKIAFLMTEPPYSTTFLKDRLNIIEKLLQKGNEIIIFFYIDATHQGNSTQAPKNFANIGNIYDEMNKKYPKLIIYACSRCTAARGYLNLEKSEIESDIFLSSKLLSFIEIVSVRKLGDLITDGYRLIQI